MAKRMYERFLGVALAAALVLGLAPTAYAEGGEISIGSAEEFLAFSESCRLDSYSRGMSVSLTADLDFTGLDFKPVPIFGGTFDGNGHQIKGLVLEAQGDRIGVFRTVAQGGTVRNLLVYATLRSGGTAQKVGAVAGENYGTLQNCSFTGIVMGTAQVGGIVGLNGATGTVDTCKAAGNISGTSQTGGVCGENRGTLTSCSSTAGVNRTELQTTMDVGGLDLGSFNLTQNLTSRTDTGGIVGLSSGLVQNCENNGDVGYSTTGYNVGGVAGQQSGLVRGCTNAGSISGRKDVGGIVGQASPYTEYAYVNDTLDDMQGQVDDLNGTLDTITDTASDTNAAVTGYASDVSSQLSATSSALQSNLSALNSLLGDAQSSTTQSINSLQGSVQTLQNAINQDGANFSQVQDTMRTELDNISQNLTSLQNTLNTDLGQAGDQLTAAGQNLEQGTQSVQNSVNNMNNALTNGGQVIRDNAQTAGQQMNDLAGSVSGAVTDLRSNDTFIQDNTNADSGEDVAAAITQCTNRGEVSGDLCVGGVAGNMNLENSKDPEDEMNSLTDGLDVASSASIRCLLRTCLNYGKVTGHKNSVGGVTGLQEVGIIVTCQNYGAVESTGGSNVGGIVGESTAQVRTCYAFCTLTGLDNVGGIAGYAAQVATCVAIPKIVSRDEETLSQGWGAVAGTLDSDNTLANNLFVSDTLGGVDGVSYTGVAEPTSYETVRALDGLPDGFSSVTLHFYAEDDVLLDTLTLDYGSSLEAENLPAIPDNKDGYYGKWPDDFDYERVTASADLHAEYQPYVQSAAAEQGGAKRPLVLATGQFKEGVTLRLDDYWEGGGAVGTVWGKVPSGAVYACKPVLANPGTSADSMTLHLQIPAGKDTAYVYLWDAERGSWKQEDVKTDGSYLVVDCPAGSSVAVATQPSLWGRIKMIFHLPTKNG